MPFKLWSKRSRSYEISSANSFIIGVYLLDNSFIECTLNSDSTGQECLDSICQRIEISETCYFGLRFVTKKLQFHWVDMDQPLKRQLDKYAQPAACPYLYFGVMFYVAEVSTILDDIARFHYYLQLKNDIVDGRLPCSNEQALNLAALSLQVELGNHEQGSEFSEVHQFLPRNMKKGALAHANLLDEVFALHAELRGVSSDSAELQYMKDVLLLDGYGCEFYIAKDQCRKDLYLGMSYAGIFVQYLDGQQSVYYRWADISRLSHSKKTFSVNSLTGFAQFQMEDSDTAKYIHRIGQLNLHFYQSKSANLRSNQIIEVSSISSLEHEKQTSMTHLPDLRSQQVTLDEISIHSEDSFRSAHSEIKHQHSDLDIGSPMLSDGVHNSSFTSSDPPSPVPVQDPVYVNRSVLLPAYRPSPNYESVMRIRMIQASVMQNPPVDQHRQQGLAYTFRQHDSLTFCHPTLGSNYVAVAHTNKQNKNTCASVSFGDHHHFVSNGVCKKAADGPSVASHSTYISQELNILKENVYNDHSGKLSLAAGYFSNEVKSLPPPYPQLTVKDCHFDVQHVSLDFNKHDSTQCPLSIAQSCNETDRIRAAAAVGQHLSPLVVQQMVGRSVECEAACCCRDFETTDGVISPESVVGAGIENASSGYSPATEIAVESDDMLDNASKISCCENLIRTRFLGPEDTTLLSPTKEVVTLAESFRQMVIAHPSVTQSSRKHYYSVIEEHPLADMLALPSVSEQLSVSPRTIFPMSLMEKLSSSEVMLPKILVPDNDQLHEMQEIFEPCDDAQLHSISSSPQSHISSSSIYCSHWDTSPDSNKPISTGPSDWSSFRNNVTANYAREHCDSIFVATCGSKTDVDMDCVENMDDKDDEHKEVCLEKNVNLDSGSESDTNQSSTVKQCDFGPLQMAALSGLTHSMILSASNDDKCTPMDNVHEILESKLADGHVFMEFKAIPKRHVDLDCDVASASHNHHRNRFKDVLPYDSTRVTLNSSSGNPDGYINASYVKVSAANIERLFIATQAPMANTAQDFWQMIWEQGVGVIVMLTDFKGIGRSVCYTYWPQETGPHNTHKYGDEFEVELQFTQHSLTYLTSKILVRYLPGNKEKMVWHLQYTDWPDQGCPDDIDGFLAFLHEIEALSRLSECDDGNENKPPLAIHCSAGVGRTGVVILTMVINLCLQHNHSVDLPKTLSWLRSQRMHMVQTLGQYRFVHNTLIQYLKNTRLI